MEHLTGAGYAGMALSAVSIGLGFVLLISQQRTRASVSISLCYISLGATIASILPLLDQVDASDPVWYSRLPGIALGGIFVGSTWYLLALLDTALVAPEQERRVRLMIECAGYGLAAIVVALCVIFPAESLNDFVMSVDEPGFLGSDGFALFGPFYLVTGIVYFVAWGYIARLRLDAGEKVRAVVACATSFFLTLMTFLPVPWAMAAFVVVIVIGTYGQFRHSAVQGERAAFLSRFLSSEVAESVRLDGLASVMEPGERDVTVVACDLRGFTAYAEAVPSQAVIDLLAEYYDAVGLAVAEVHGTVKDYAGDGVLMVVGAPLPRGDHATVGLTLARRLHEVVEPVLRHWSTAPHPLGMGVGVASGPVTAGALGSSTRMEYTVVGTPVNLAARLCSAAEHGQTLVASSTVALAGTAGLEARAPMAIKGLAADQTVYAL